MFDSFSASFPSRNTHPIRNLVTLLSMSHRFGYFCNEIHVAVHSLRQVHSTGHSECVFVVRRDLLLSLWRAQSLGVSASRFPSRGSWPAFFIGTLYTGTVRVQPVAPRERVGKPRVSGYAQVPASPLRLS